MLANTNCLEFKLRNLNVVLVGLFMRKDLMFKVAFSTDQATYQIFQLSAMTSCVRRVLQLRVK